MDFFWAVLPLLLTQLFVLLMITLFPQIVTFLPDLLMGPGT
jgi:TRAP-type C4-dicarboxylate transport system permease large subunit